MMIKDSCPCGATLTIQIHYNYAYEERVAHNEWLKAHRVCRVKEPFESPETTCKDCGHLLPEGKRPCEYCELMAKVERLTDMLHETGHAKQEAEMERDQLREECAWLKDKIKDQYQKDIKFGGINEPL